MLDAFSYSGRPTKEPLADTEVLTSAVAAWLRDVMFAAVDPDALAPDAFLKELTWDRRHIFQSAGLFDQIPWKVM